MLRVLLFKPPTKAPATLLEYASQKARDAIIAALLFSALVPAQTEDRARDLLTETISSARNTLNWRAEGIEVMELTGEGVQSRNEVHFKMAVQGPLKMRWEVTGDERTLSVCDGADKWTYYAPGVSFHRTAAAASPNGCGVSPAYFYKLEDNPASATVIGHDQVQLADGLEDCEVVRTEWNTPPATAAGGSARSVRTFCIDPVRHLILRDSLDGEASGLRVRKTTTYTSYESNPNLPPDTFEFSAPTGTLEDQGPQMGADDSPSSSGVYLFGSPEPRLISKVEPSYTEEARQAGVSGMALVSLTVGPDGIPRNPHVTRGLGHGLDEKAIESISQWHFEPGMKDGAPVAVGPVTIAVNFRLP